MDDGLMTGTTRQRFRSVAMSAMGQKADIGLPPVDVRFTPKSGHCRAALGCPLCADFVAEVGGYGLLVIDHRF
jgi:hypothetical protein